MGATDADRDHRAPLGTADFMRAIPSSVTKPMGAGNTSTTYNGLKIRLNLQAPDYSVTGAAAPPDEPADKPSDLTVTSVRPFVFPQTNHPGMSEFAG